MEKASIPVGVQKEIVTELEQIFRIVDDKPYFELKYKKVGEDYYHVGYSSYDFHNVLKWKEEYFELVKENYKETIKKLRYPELPDGLVMVDLETRQEAIKALEKQIPRKVNNLSETYLDFGVGKKIKVGACGNCPNCNYNIDIVSKYCTRCGQKLDWREEE
jgi:hypothetical protein|nr:MAG TPA: PROTEIN/RNA Complex, archaeal, ribosomal, 50S, protein.0A [Caudoviricetes sp.]